jgi:hypothetical protein
MVTVNKTGLTAEEAWVAYCSQASRFVMKEALEVEPQLFLEDAQLS